MRIDTKLVRLIVNVVPYKQVNIFTEIMVYIINYVSVNYHREIEDREATNLVDLVIHIIPVAHIDLADPTRHNVLDIIVVIFIKNVICINLVNGIADESVNTNFYDTFYSDVNVHIFNKQKSNIYYTKEEINLNSTP